MHSDPSFEQKMFYSVHFFSIQQIITVPVNCIFSVPLIDYMTEPTNKDSLNCNDAFFMYSRWQCLITSLYQPMYISVTVLEKSSDAHMCRQTGPLMVYVMACQLFGDEPLPKQIVAYRQLDPREHFIWNS